MELFSVSCITCRAKLKVKQLSAIGQILPCPKCHGMVQIVAPPGWKPPAAPLAPAPSAAGAPAGPRVSGSPPTTEGTIYTAQLVHDDDPLTRPRAASPGDRKLRLILVGVVALLALGIVGFGIWSSIGGSDNGEGVAAGDPASTANPPTAGPSTTPAAGNPGNSSAIPSGTPPAGSSPAAAANATGAASSVPAAAGSPTVPIAALPGTTVPGAAATTSPSSTAPLASPSPTQTVVVMAAPSGTVVAPPLPQVPQPPVPQPPAASPTSTRPAAPPAVPAVDVAARLEQKIPALKFERTPLRAALAVVGELAGVPIRYDWSTLPLDFRPDDPVSLTSEEATLAAVLDQLTKDRGLRVAAADGMLEVAGPSVKEAPTPIAVDLPVDDLYGTELAGAELGKKLVQTFVAPNSWDRPGGGSIAAAPGKVVISHSSRVQEEASRFLNRIRAARGKPPRASGATAAVAPDAETRTAKAREMFERPVTMNFRPGAPTAVVLAHIEKATSVTIVVDYAALATAGFSVDEPIGISAREHPLADVLDALCRPRAWGWRLVRDSIIEITSHEAARNRTYVELYDVRPLLAEQSVETVTARVIDATPDFGWDEIGGRVSLAIDIPSGRLIVLQTQDGHRRLEKLLKDWTTPAGAAPAGPAAAGPAGVPGGTPPAPLRPTPSPTAR